MKHIFVINPNSGKNKKKKIEDTIEKACKKLKYDYEIHMTTGPEDATRFVRNLENAEPATIYAVGGDGIVNEVVNGITGSGHMLSVIPSGSGNDYFKSLIKSKKEYIKSDVGKINDKYFINTACIGIDADVAANVPAIRRIPIIPVSQRYNASLVYTFFKYRAKTLTFKFGEASKKTRTTIVAICNGQFYGGGFRIAPHAMIDDGQFEIYIVEKMSKLSILKLLLKLKKAKHEEDERVQRFTDSDVEIISEKPVVCNIDGESIKDTNFKIEMIRNAITVYKNTELLEELGIIPGKKL